MASKGRGGCSAAGASRCAPALSPCPLLCSGTSGHGVGGSAPTGSPKLPGAEAVCGQWLLLNRERRVRIVTEEYPDVPAERPRLR